MSEKTRSFLVLALLLGLVFGGTRLFQSRNAEEQGQVLRGVAREGDIVMLSSETCIYCRRAREWLTEQRVPFRECFIERDAACRADYAERGARGTPTFVVKGQTQLGFDPGRISRRLANPG